MRINKSKPPKRLVTSSIVKSIRMKVPSRSKKSAPGKKGWGWGSATVVAGLSVSAVALLIAMWPAPPQNDDVRAAQSAGSAPGNMRATARPQSTAAPMSKASTATAARPANPPAHRLAVDAADRTPDVRDTAAVARDESQISAVTITGCLEQDDEAFRLKDADGADAPKARSWKSGFLKKRAASVALVDSAHRLPGYVGQRIAATGTLANREMQVHSVQRVASSCG